MAWAALSGGAVARLELASGTLRVCPPALRAVRCPDAPDAPPEGAPIALPDGRRLAIAPDARALELSGGRGGARRLPTGQRARAVAVDPATGTAVVAGDVGLTLVPLPAPAPGPG